MKRISRQANVYAAVLAVIAAILLFWSASGLPYKDIARADVLIAFIIFFVLSVLFEIFSVGMPRFGYCSLAFAVYFAVIFKYDFSFAVIFAAVGMLVREFFFNRQAIIYRVANFSINLITVALSGIIFSVIGRDTTFLSGINALAMLVCAVSFYSIEYILISTFISFLDEETRKNYESAKNKIRLFFYSLAPMGLFIVLSYYISPWLLPLMILLLFALRQAIMLGIREIEIVNQEELIKKLNSVSRTLKIVEEQNKDLELDLNKKIDEQNILMELGEALGTSVNLEGTLEIVVSMIRKLVVYQSCVIFLIDQGQLVAAKSVTPYRDMLEYSSLLKLEETIVNLVVQNKKAIIIPDMQAMGEQRIFKNERSLICIPLIVKNEIIGVIYVGATHPGTYNEDHLHLLSILGNAASNAIRTAQLYKQLEQAFVGQKNLNAQLDSRVQAFEMLLEVGQKLGSSLNLDEAQKVIIDGLDAMFNYQSAAIFLIKMGIKGAVFAPTKFRSPYEKYFENLQIAFDDQSNVMGWVAHYRKPLLLTDTRDTRLQTVLEKERSIMVVPMIVESEITGALYVGHSNPNFFNEEALSLLEAVAHNSAMAIKHAEIYERTARRAITDGLTGLYSHRYFQERLLEEINHARRRHIGLALLMIDADHFKTLNDTLGHPEGDLCLKTLAEIMKQHTRDSDVLCRIGGDEFTILLKEIDKKNAIIKAEAIRQGVQAKFYDARVQITTSIGIACFPEDADNTKDLIAAADAALYKSKKLGRNRVSVA